MAASLVVAVSSCGGDDDAAPAAASETTSATPTTLAGPPATTADGAIIVDINAGDYYFTSSLTTFEVGVPYHFVVHNTGLVEHEFMIVEPIAAGEMSMEMMDDMAVGHIEEDDLEAGDTSELDVTFTEPAAAGTLELSCHIGDHYQKGMHLPIIVTT